ncbi:efflux RND transporter periplasmic adaptor subunit [Capilliphycus salinus ALCB114379]|uniref:efflux RND transporter periplasmic adaptor subunit n=1 Tax=Capilliphycus salinus TaxID=2768948 RepID=UPI0039A65617
MPLNSAPSETSIVKFEDSSEPPEKIPNRRFRLPILLTATGVLLLGGIFTVPLVSNNQVSPTAEESGESRILPVETLTVQRSDRYEVSRSYTGEIAALRASDLGFERGGKLIEVFVSEGDRVEAGQILARLESEEIEAQLSQAEAALDRFQADLAELEAGSRPEDIAAAQARLNRAQANLAELEAGSRSEDIAIAIAELDEAEARLADARSGSLQDEIARAEASLRANKADLKLASERVRRYQALRQEGAISQDSLEEYLQNERRLEALVDEAQRRIEQLKQSRGSQVDQLEATVEQRRQTLRKLQNGPRLENIAAARAEVEEARSNLNELINGTRPEDIAAARAQVREAQAQVRYSQTQLKNTKIRATFAGIVARREVDEGTVVQAGQPVIHLVENAAPEARIGLPTSMSEQLQIGSSQTVEIGSQTYEATVSSILPEVDPSTRTQIVVFTLERSAIRQINPGQTVRVNLTETIPTEGYWLPTESLSSGIRGLWTCYVLTQTDNSKPEIYEIQQQSVEILHQESDRVLVRGTLQTGDRVVANGVHRLVPGQKVNPLDVASQFP